MNTFQHPEKQEDSLEASCPLREEHSSSVNPATRTGLWQQWQRIPFSFCHILPVLSLKIQKFNRVVTRRVPTLQLRRLWLRWTKWWDGRRTAGWVQVQHRHSHPRVPQELCACLVPGEMLFVHGLIASPQQKERCGCQASSKRESDRESKGPSFSVFVTTEAQGSCERVAHLWSLQ